MGIIEQIEIKVCELYCKGVYKGYMWGMSLKRIIDSIKANKGGRRGSNSSRETTRKVVKEKLNNG